MDNKVERIKSFPFPCGFESSFKAGLYDFRYVEFIIRYHKKVLQTLSIGF